MIPQYAIFFKFLIVRAAEKSCLDFARRVSVEFMKKFGESVGKLN